MFLKCFFLDKSYFWKTKIWFSYDFKNLFISFTLFPLCFKAFYIRVISGLFFIKKTHTQPLELFYK